MQRMCISHTAGKRVRFSFRILLYDDDSICTVYIKLYWILVGVRYLPQAPRSGTWGALPVMT